MKVRTDRSEGLVLGLPALFTKKREKDGARGKKCCERVT